MGGRILRSRISTAIASFLIMMATAGSAFAAPTSAAEQDCQSTLAATPQLDQPATLEGFDGYVERPTLRVNIDYALDGAACTEHLQHPPLLLGAHTRESLIIEETETTVFVTYVDLDNDPPQSIEIVFDGKPKPMAKSRLSSQSDYRHGVLYESTIRSNIIQDVVVPELTLGHHTLTIRASDGTHEVEVPVEMPHITARRYGALLAPNPTNRLLIHPIANGPMFTPPSEVLPPLSRLVSDAPQGTYSYSFPIEPEAAQLRARWSVGTNSDFDLPGRGLLEGPPGAEFELLGAAATTPEAHVGKQAVDLAPSGAVADSTGLIGALRIEPKTALYVAHVGHIISHQRIAPGSQSFTVRTILEADQNFDGTKDLCLVHEAPAVRDDQWRRLHLQQSTPMQAWILGCQVPSGSPQALDTLQDNATLGLARVLAVRYEARLEAGQPSDGPLRIDSLRLNVGFSNTNADMDGCIYGSSAPPASPLQPIACDSDIGPSGGVLSSDTTMVNVWADTMFPALDLDTLLPHRPYLEPARLTVSLQALRPVPQFELPAVPNGRIRLVHDLNANQQWDADEPVLASQAQVKPTLNGFLQFEVPFDVPDGPHAFLAVYDPDLAGVASSLHAFSVLRFVNDFPSNGFEVEKHPHPKHTVTFYPVASDADDAQGALIQELGGLTAWRLDPGDGRTVYSGSMPMPASIDHIYYKHQTYTARWTVTDARGAQAVTSIDIEIGGHARWSADIE